MKKYVKIIIIAVLVIILVAVGLFVGIYMKNNFSDEYENTSVGEFSDNDSDVSDETTGNVAEKEKTTVVAENKEKASENNNTSDLVLICSKDEGYKTAKFTVIGENEFLMVVNLLEGYGNITGSYIVTEEGSYVCTVEDKDFSGFVGDEISGFTLKPINEDKYIINLHNVDYIGDLSDGCIFVY